MEFLLRLIAQLAGDFIFDPIIGFFTSTSVPLTILFSIVMLLSIASWAARKKFGAHKYLGTPTAKFAPFFISFFLLLGMYVAGAFKEGDIADTSQRGTHVQLSGEYQISSVGDPALGGHNLSLTPVDIMTDPEIVDKWRYSKTTHWDDWQVDERVNISAGEIVTVVIDGDDQRLFAQQKQRPEEESSGFFSWFSDNNSDESSIP